jgi:siroheme synthase-like protein
VLLVGGGKVALQKLPALLEAEAALRVVAPEVLPEIEAGAREGKFVWHARRYETADVHQAALVIAATDDAALQKQVAADCRARNIWVNVVDVVPLCDFIAPALVRQGDVQVAISTGGAAPALAKFLRRKLEPIIGPEYGALARLVRQVRPEILKMPKARRDLLWDRIVSEPFIEEVRRDGPARAEERLKEWIYGNAAI